MTTDAGYNLTREPLRALAHAQGQLIHSHKDLLLFFAIDTLTHITGAKDAQELKAACPQAFAAAEKFAPFLANASKRQAMFGWDAGDATAECTDALRALADTCREPRHARLAGTMVAYLDMAADIRRPDLTHTFRQAATVNPYTTAAFIAAYLQRLAGELGQNEASSAMAQKLETASRELEAFLPETGNAPGRLYALMDKLSATADLARAIEKSVPDNTQLKQALHFCFITAAVYDWRQFERPASDKPAAPPDNIVEFRPRAGR